MKKSLSVIMCLVVLFINAFIFPSNSVDLYVDSTLSKNDVSWASASGVLDSGEFYLNNSCSGKYLCNNDGSLASISGLISNCGNSIKWNITALSDGSYTIQPSGNASLYLACSVASNSANLNLTVLNDAAIPNQYSK